MDASSFRPESHMAQQSWRYKLRIQHASSQSLREFPGNSEHLSVHPAATGLLQARNVGNDTMLCDSPVLSSEMVSFSSGCNVSSSAQRDGMANRLIRGHEDSSFTNVCNYSVLSDTNLDASPRAGASDPQGCGGNWRGLDSQQSCGWMVNYAGGSIGGEGNEKPIFVDEVLSNNARVSCLSTSPIPVHLKPNYDGYHDVQLQSNLANPICGLSPQVGEKQLKEIKFTYHPIHQSAFQDIETPAAVRGNDRGLGPSANSQSVYQSTLQNENANSLISRQVENCHQWGDELRHVARKSDQELRTMGIDASTHGLSLSLSSNPPSNMNAMPLGEELYDSEYLQAKGRMTRDLDQDSKFAKSSYSGPLLTPAIISKSCGKSLNDMVTPSSYVLQNTGPLGPFTGYATILKSSRFLKSAQELLDEFCRLSGTTVARASETSGGLSGDFSTAASAGATVVIAEAEAKGNCNSAVSSSTLQSSNEGSGDGGVGRTSRESIWPEYQQKKAKLLYLQEEVCRRYKQYHQQMQIIGSSFELVAGLSVATPYLSSALKAVSRSFRCLKRAISEQLKQIAKALGEDFLSRNAGASSSKSDTGASSLRYMDHSLQKYKPGGASVGLLDPQQHIWRPQRGLPERAVAILRAWLFEHFLHPYPTDTDKHMLAAQTGLSRNQVSNWFINARVRVWKPMVEEIHILETKGMAESNQSSMKNNGNSREGARQPNDEQPVKKLGTVNSMLSKQLECSGVGFSVSCEEQLGTEQCNQEKRSRIEFHNPTNMDGSSMNFLPYHRSGIDMGGLGTVSLTLGLRHGVDNAQHRQQLQQHEDQLIRRQFEGQMIHDFTG